MGPREGARLRVRPRGTQGRARRSTRGCGLHPGRARGRSGPWEGHLTLLGGRAGGQKRPPRGVGFQSDTRLCAAEEPARAISNSHSVSPVWRMLLLLLHRSDGEEQGSQQEAVAEPDSEPRPPTPHSPGSTVCAFPPVRPPPGTLCGETMHHDGRERARGGDQAVWGRHGGVRPEQATAKRLRPTQAGGDTLRSRGHLPSSPGGG